MDIRNLMRAKGHDVIEYHYRTDLDTLLASRSDVFRKVRE
jgi:hypothetical protein